MKTETLREYADRLGAELSPTSLEGMPVVSESESNRNFYLGCDLIIAWVNVKDPSGGVNKTGVWPFSVVEKRNGQLAIHGGGL